MKSIRVNWNLSLEDAEAILQILKDHGNGYTAQIRHEKYDNADVTNRLRKLIQPKQQHRHNVFISEIHQKP